MEWGPVVASTRRNKAGAALIALQIAVTLAVLCNALFIIGQRTADSRSASGVRDEAEVFVVSNEWIGQGAELAARERTDLAALRSLPQVSDAIVSNDHPLGGPAMTFTVTLDPDHPLSGSGAMSYFVDDHALNTLGLRLVAGRNFRADEIVIRQGINEHAPSLAGVIVTKALANRLVPGGHVLGRTLTLLPDATKAPVIGVVATLATSPQVAGTPYEQLSMLFPYLWADSQVFYIVRAQPGRLAVAMQAVRARLEQVSRRRVIMGMQTLAEVRRDAFQGDRGLAQIMALVCAILLAATASGIVGLTSYWVSQRRRQIGIRRVMGATRGAILRYFQIENLLIAGAGVILGVALALAANLWVLQSVALGRLPTLYPMIGVATMLLLGQLAVLWPALRAASIPPAEATRNV